MDVKAVKVDNYFRRIEVNGIPIIGITKIRSIWECDTNNREFKTIQDAKDYAVEHFAQFSKR